MKNNRIKRVLPAIVSLLFFVVIVFFANAFFGNPVSKIMAEKSAENYIAEVYPDTDYEIEGAGFDFKSTNYNVHIISPSSPDSSFTLMYNMMGKLIYDSYEYRVLERGNTVDRIWKMYREMTDNIFEGKLLSFEPDIAFGEIEFTPRQYRKDVMYDYALISDELELDMDYDIKALAAKAGHLTVYVYDKVVTTEHLSVMLLELRRVFDEAGVPFYAVDFVIEYPRAEDGTQKEGRVEVMNFLYEDIYEEGLIERVEKSNKKAIAYYAEQDAVKEAEIID